MCKKAAANLERYYALQGKTAPEWHVINADAREFAVPADVTVFYMANPFDALVMGRVLDNIAASVRSVPRKCYIIYANPIHERSLIERGFDKIDVPATDFVIYTLE